MAERRFRDFGGGRSKGMKGKGLARHMQERENHSAIIAYGLDRWAVKCQLYFCAIQQLIEGIYFYGGSRSHERICHFTRFKVTAIKVPQDKGLVLV